MRLVLTAISGGLALALLLAPAVGPGNPAAAEDGYRGEAEPSPGELAGEAMSKLMQALDLLIGSIPQYEAPYVNENGDIVIRRKHGETDDDLPTPRQKPLPPEIDTTTI